MRRCSDQRVVRMPLRNVLARCARDDARRAPPAPRSSPPCSRCLPASRRRPDPAARRARRRAGARRRGEAADRGGRRRRGRRRLARATAGRCARTRPPGAGTPRARTRRASSSGSTSMALRPALSRLRTEIANAQTADPALISGRACGAPDRPLGRGPARGRGGPVRRLRGVRQGGLSGGAGARGARGSSGLDDLVTPRHRAQDRGGGRPDEALGVSRADARAFRELAD